jgi:hypothetical protein
MLKNLFSAAATVLTFAFFFPYIRSIFRGRTRPHVFSWVIWGMGTLTVFFAQLSDGAGIGAWPIGLSGVMTIYVASLSWAKHTDLGITSLDWSCLLTALLALPAWLLTSDPLWAVLILTTVDLIGFGPTIRKSYYKPNEERIWLFSMGALRNAFVIAALENYSVTTVTFPAAVGIACLMLVPFIALCRQAQASEQAHRAA